MQRFEKGAAGFGYSRAIVHFRVAGLLQEMLEWHSTPAGFEYEDVLRAVCPAIYDLWKAYPNFLPVYVKDLVKVIIDRSKEIENAMPEIGELPSLPEHDPLRQPDRKHSRYRVTGAYYGAHFKRVRPRYNIDSNLHKPKKGQCEKMFLTHQHQTGGIMIAWCKHRIAVGFHIIPRQEGRNDVYSVLYQRWQKAPRTIVYDFACQLHKYSITREAVFFRDTKHVIDEHHSDNHTACSEAYRMKPYKQYNDEWTFFNDSAAECGNSGLAKAKLSSSYMGLARFMDFARLQLEFQNRKRILKLVDLHKSSSLSDARPQWQVIQTKMTYLHQKHAAIAA